MRRASDRSAYLFVFLTLSMFIAPAGTAGAERLDILTTEREAGAAKAGVPDAPLAPQWFFGVEHLSYFGRSVGEAGDVNGDGFSDLIIGIQRQDAERGRVQLYFGSPEGFQPIPDWVADGPEPEGKFGAAVGTAGDVNGDGFDDFLVGAPLSVARGQAFLYLGSAGGPTATPVWTATGEIGLSYFGASLGTAGDVNGDGRDDVIVGAPRDLVEGERYGRARVYLGTALGLTPEPVWSQRGTQPEEEFGFSVGTAGDVNGDGFDDVVIGAPLHDGVGADSGRAEVYLGSSIGPEPVAAWWLDATLRHRLGHSVGTAGDVNGDGYADVIVGAYSNWPMALVFHGSSTGLSWSPDWTRDISGYPLFGWSVGTAGDVNDDGHDDVIVGAPRYEPGTPPGDEIGGAFVYLGSATGLDELPVRILTGTTRSDFGYDVGTLGDVNADGRDDIVVGAPGYRVDGEILGAVHTQFGPLECLDEDEDGLCPPLDCDDTNPHCGEDCTDGDGDAYCVGSDCDDTNSHCTADCTDGDGDGYCAPFDCDDAAAGCTDSCEDNDGDGLWLCGDDCDDSNSYCGLDCTDLDGDGHCVGLDCDEANPNCTVDCTDGDGDGLCPPHDCDDSTADCTTDCADNDLDFVRACDFDCDDTNPNCRVDCTDNDGDGYCADIDCNDQEPYCAARCDGPDSDGDSIHDYCDNCVSVTNVDQADGDQDGAGDVCDVCPEDPSYASLGLETLWIFDGPACADSLGVGPSGNVYFGCKYYFDAFTRDGLFLSRVDLVEHQADGTTDTAVGPKEWVYLARDAIGPDSSNAYDLAGNRRMELGEAKRIEVGDDGYIYRLYFYSFGGEVESFWRFWKWHPDGLPGYSTAQGGYGYPNLTRDICVGDDGLSYLVLREGFSNPPLVEMYSPSMDHRGTITLGWDDDPVACEVDSHGTVYVADRAESRIRIYDWAGRHARDFGAQLPSAQIVDLAMGPDDLLYVLYDTAQVMILTAPVFDWDGDSVLYCDDNCPYVSNRAQADLDFDGVGDTCDLDDGLIYLLLEPETLIWQDEEGYDAWNRYRGDLVELKSGGDYTQAPGSNPLAKRDCGLTDTWLNDYFWFDPDLLAFYLVSGVSGGVEGDLGQDSSGQTRPNANPCP